MNKSPRNRRALLFGWRDIRALEDRIDHLKSLHTTVVGARNGYEEALNDAGNVLLVFRALINSRRQADHPRMAIGKNFAHITFGTIGAAAALSDRNKGELMPCLFCSGLLEFRSPSYLR